MRRFTWMIVIVLLIGLVSMTSAQEDTTTDEDSYTPLNFDTLYVVDILQTDLRSGPANTSSYLAPDGKKFAYNTGREICIYTLLLTVDRCFDLRAETTITNPDFETVVWSPDSRYLALHNHFLIYLIQSDIHILDTETGDIVVIDPDEQSRIDIGGDDWGRIDLNPQWLRDGRLAFLRYTSPRTEDLPNPRIMVFNPDDNTVENIGILQADIESPFAAYAWGVSTDNQTLAHNYFLNSQTPNDGIWISAIDGSSPRHLVQTQTLSDVPLALTFSPDGRYLLGYADREMAMYGTTTNIEHSPVRLFDVETGERVRVDDERFVIGGGWSPDGTLFAYLVRFMIDPSQDGLYVTDSLGTAGRRILEGAFIPPTTTWRQALTWADNNTLLMTNYEEGYSAVIIQLGD